MTEPTTVVLAAGDHFVSPRMLAAAVLAEVPGVDVKQLMLPWPVEPFGPVGGVDEASGSEEQMIDALVGVDVCVTQMAPMTRRVFEASPQLRLVCVGRGGPVNVDLGAAAEHGVTVTFTPGRNAVATAEHTVALLLAAARRIPSTHGDLIGGTWRGDYYVYDQVGPEVSGSTVGVVGFGAIGRRVAALLSGFGARVLVADPYADDDDVRKAGYEPASFGDTATSSQFLTLHARATPETHGLVSKEVVQSMPAGSVLVNCARGSLVDYEAVCDALDEGHLFGAAFDVFPVEPVPPGSRLLTTPGLVLTPHLAGASRQTANNAARMAAVEVARLVNGQGPLHPA